MINDQIASNDYESPVGQSLTLHFLRMGLAVHHFDLKDRKGLLTRLTSFRCHVRNQTGMKEWGCHFHRQPLFRWDLDEQGLGC